MDRSSSLSSPADRRRRALDALSAEPVDLLVIGGGIVGAGVARDGAMRGLRTALVDQADFASGTSSRSSRLLHGGLRYLAQGRIKLVREANHEKRVLGRIAPHLAEPLAFVFPTRRQTSWPRWKLAIGVHLYDWLCGWQRNYGRSGVLGRKQTMAQLPHLATTNLTGAVRYFDALTNDSRLVIDTIRSAAVHGAEPLNYVRLQNAIERAGLWQCELAWQDLHQTCVVEARTVVNATGPWSARIPGSRTSLRLTKGVHLVFERERLPITEAVVMAEGNRILFAIPWGERVIVGTTDTDYEGPLEEPACEEADIRYLLQVVNKTFPSLELTPADILSTWAGVRPLVADTSGGPSDISRRHEVKMGRPGWWDITGGKLTTYRLMAEETINAILRYLGRDAVPCRTAHQPLLAPRETMGISGILPPVVTADVVRHFCRHEWAEHLDDVMIRRTSWRHYYRDHLEIATRVAQWMAEELNWDTERSGMEISRYRQLVGAATTKSPHFALVGNRQVDRLQELAAETMRGRSSYVKHTQ